MSLYDDVADLGGAFGGASSHSGTADEQQQRSDLASGWNNNSYKLLQYQVEAANKRRQQAAASSHAKRDMTGRPQSAYHASISPVIDLSTDRRVKPQLQLIKDVIIAEPNSSPLAAATNYKLTETSRTLTTVGTDGTSLNTSADEYDPMRPNDYEKLVAEMRRNGARKRDKRDTHRDRHRTDREDRDRDRSRRNEDDERRGGDSRRRSGSHSDDDDRRNSTKRPHGSGVDESRAGKRQNMAAFAPPPSLIAEDSRSSLTNEPNNEDTYRSGNKLAVAQSGMQKAEKMMAKMGYREGDGLGRNAQGMSIALQVEKTGKRLGRIIHEKDQQEMDVDPILMPPGKLAPPMGLTPPPQELTPAPAMPAPPAQGIPHEVMKNMSKVVLLKNMVGPGDVDDTLDTETKEECQKYGEVNKVLIFEMPDRAPEETVRIFIEFKTLPSAIKALTDLNGRYFGGRVVKALFYNLDKFKRFELADDP